MLSVQRGSAMRCAFPISTMRPISTLMLFSRRNFSVGKVSSKFKRNQTTILKNKLAVHSHRMKNIKPATRDYIEHWGRDKFYMTAIGWNALTILAVAGLQASPLILIPSVGFAVMGFNDIRSNKTMRVNFPVLCRIRYGLESIRPEIRQYFIEGDAEDTPIPRNTRNLIYIRAKARGESNPFGTKLQVYDTGYEWIGHSNLGAKHLDMSHVSKVWLGNPGVEEYYASRFNISGMSYGSLSHAAQSALNWGARMGNFYHNTGEGGISDYHRYAGADVCWNIGTGYFGCRDKETGAFSPDVMRQSIEKTPGLRMIELKLSQGAKPGHGGIMPAAKLTAEIAEIRGVPMGKDVLSPPWHSEFSNPKGLMEFLCRLRKISNKPVGFKFCVGQPIEVAAIIKAYQESVAAGNTPIDFITVDGGEGGTGAAPLEFSDHVGAPLREGLVLVTDLLDGAGVRDQVRIIASGKIHEGFSMVRAIALGADMCNAARGFMFALGCIQALKCNSNKCPTGITTTDETLIKGLHVPAKALRVKQYHENTLASFSELLGAAGVDNPALLRRHHIMRRISPAEIRSYEDLFPSVRSGCLLKGEGPPHLQRLWDSV